MGCGGCKKRREARAGNRSRGMQHKRTGDVYDVLNGQKHVTNSQLKARLETFKKRHCTDCPKRYDCNYEIYLKCTIRPQ